MSKAKSKSVNPKVSTRAFRSRRREAPAARHRDGAGADAFDPAEYLDVLIATGHLPLVYGNYYAERMPDRPLSDDEWERVCSARAKLHAASTGLPRVVQECIKRGLVDDVRTAERSLRAHTAPR
jgi:hypothetical protein